jgi:glycosyltransferase involved in cell wall biosynthesis
LSGKGQGELNRGQRGKIRVLFFISSLEGGGAERVMVEILNSLDRERIEPVLVLLCPYENSPYRESLHKDLTVIVLERTSDTLFGKIRQSVQFIKTVREVNPHLLMSFLTHNNIMAIVAGILLRIKTIVCEHSTLSEVIKTREGEHILGLPTSSVVKLLYRFAERVIAVSHGVRSDLVEKFSIPPHKVRVIYNPVDVDRIHELSNIPAEHPFLNGGLPLVITVGRLIWQKGFETLIRAFQMVVQEMDARLLILGEGPERKSLEKLIQDIGVAGKVSLPGFQRNPYAFLSGADVFVLSSVYEGLPMVILEAMACGTPVIATDCKYGPREILQEGRCGLLVPAGEVYALSAGLSGLLGDKALREEFSRLGGERIKEFSAEKIIEQYEQVIRESVG